MSNHSINGPKVIFFDLETAGVQGLKADLGFVVCFGWKWQGEKDAHVITLLDHPGKDCQDDSRLLHVALRIMESADLVVAHYGAKFDLPFLRSRLARAGLKPIPQTRNCDTCLIARSYYKLSSNRLDNLAKFLDVKDECGKPVRKAEKEWPEWWMGALRGDRTCIKRMAEYCKQDVRTLESVFAIMRPTIPGRYLLHLGIGRDHYCCLACGGDIQFRGHYYSEKKLWRRFQCKKCGRWGREDKAIARPFSGHQPVK